MNRLKCMVVHDKGWAIEGMKKLFLKAGVLEFIASEINSQKALTFIRENEIDVLFLDAEMEETDFVELILQVDPSIKIVLCSSRNHIPIEAINLSTVYFLIKPIQVTPFLQCAQKLGALLKEEAACKEQDANPAFFMAQVERKSKLVRIDYADISYLEADSGGAKMHFVNDKEPLFINKSLKKVEAFFPKGFMRIHDRFIIALANVAKYEDEHVYLKNSTKERISLGANYKSFFFAFVNDLSIP